MSTLFASTSALQLLAQLAGVPDVKPLAYFEHPGIPIPKGRPRFTRTGHTYTPGRTQDAANDLAVMFQIHVRPRPIAGPLALVTLFYVADQRRIDVDNCSKLVMDAATAAGVWHDDSQVVAHTAIVDFDPDRPRTVIALAPAISRLSRVPSAQKAKRHGAADRRR